MENIRVKDFHHSVLGLQEAVYDHDNVMHGQRKNSNTQKIC